MRYIVFGASAEFVFFSLFFFHFKISANKNTKLKYLDWPFSSFFLLLLLLLWSLSQQNAQLTLTNPIEELIPPLLEVQTAKTVFHFLSLVFKVIVSFSNIFFLPYLCPVFLLSTPSGSG